MKLMFVNALVPYVVHFVIHDPYDASSKPEVKRHNITKSKKMNFRNVTRFVVWRMSSSLAGRVDGLIHKTS